MSSFDKWAEDNSHDITKAKWLSDQLKAAYAAGLKHGKWEGKCETCRHYFFKEVTMVHGCRKGVNIEFRNTDLFGCSLHEKKGGGGK